MRGGNTHEAIDEVEQARANRLFQTEATWPLPDEERWVGRPETHEAVFVLAQTRAKENKSMPQPELIALIYAFTSQTRARQAFEAMRQIIATHDCQLSAYRYWIGSKQAGEAWHVMVVGDPATFSLKDHMSQVLTHFGGTEATLAADMVEVFYQRHRNKMGRC